MAEENTPDFSLLNQSQPTINPALLSSVNPELTQPGTSMSDVAIRKLDPLVGKIAPGLYASGSTTPLSKEDQNLVENWAKVKDLHDKLMAMPNQKAAKQFELLAPNFQKALTNYYGIDYSTKPNTNELIDSPEWRQSQTKQEEQKDTSLFTEAKNIVSSTFREIMHGAEFYYKAFMTPIHAIENAAINNESFWSKKNWNSAFDGKMLYDNGELDKLTKKYGQETAYVATHILAGQTPGQIIQQYGPKSKAILEEVNKLLNHADEYQPILEEFDKARLSIGRDSARWVLRAFGKNPNEESGLFKTISGTLDAATSIFADPLTYLTMGGSAVLKGASTSTRLAEKLLESQDVAAHFANPEVARYWNDYGKAIDQLKDATTTGDKVKAAEVRDSIEKNFQEHGTWKEQSIFLEAAKASDGPFNFEEYWHKAENFARLIRGDHAGTLWAREGAAFSRTSRATTLGVKHKIMEFFVGKPDFAKLDAEDADKLIKGAIDYGADRLRVGDHTALDDLIERKAAKGLRTFIRRQTAYAPGSRAVKVNDDVAETIDVFRRQAFVALNDRVMADTLAEHFLTASQSDRINIKRFIDEQTFRRFGIHNMGPEGQKLMDNMLGSKYGFNESFATRENMAVPAHFGTTNAGKEIEIVGPIAPHQFQDELRAYDWRKVKEFAAGKYKGSNPADESSMEKVSRLIGGAYSNRITNAITDVWSVLTLVPQLGIRTAIDEGYQFAMYMNLPMFKNIANAKRSQRVMNALYGTKSGPAKELLFEALSKATGSKVGASRFITAEEKEALRQTKIAEAKASGSSQWQAEREWRNELFDMAISKYGSKLPDHYKGYLRELTHSNPHAMLDSTSSRNITAAMSGRDDFFKTDSHMFSEDALNKALADWNLEATGVFRSERADSFAKTDLQLHMFRQFVTYFNANDFSKYATNTANRALLDPMAIFLKRNGLATEKDVQLAISDFLSGFGITKANGVDVLTRDAEKSISKFVQSSTQFEKYKDVNDVAKVRMFAEDMFSNLYHVFHGDAAQYNQKLMNYFKPFTTGKVGDHRILLNQMDLEKYQGLTADYLAKGRIYTDLETPVTSFTEAVRRFGINGAYDLMARQTDSILRQPAVHMHYLLFRDQYAATEKLMQEQVYKERLQQILAERNKHFAGQLKVSATDLDKEKALEYSKEVASRHFTQQAMDNAARHMLKFSDNPEMRTIFADNVRAIGRFYRAVEDLHRRSYRLMRDNGLGTLYKMRLMNQGFASVGHIHEDVNGDQYAILPFDNVIYGAVNNTLRVLDPNAQGVNQPIWDNITFKLTAGNPSFQNDAGMPYLSGPLGAVSVMLVKGILNAPDVPMTNSLAQKVDNFALGSYGDNINLQKAFMPRFVQNIWNALNPDEKSQQETSAVTQAVCYNVANGINVPDINDDKYKKANGYPDTDLYNKDKADYLKQIRISAHNITVMRSLLGTILPSTVQLSDTKGLPDYLMSAGLPSLQSSFYDVLDAIKEKHPDVEDPYEMALATWMGDNPGKLVYTLSKKDKEITPIMKYSKQMENWVIGNKQAVDKYGSGALLFAPNTGKFDPGTFNYMRAAGLVSNTDVEAFFDKALMQSAVNKYYDINDLEENTLTNIPFSDIGTRQAVVNMYKSQRNMMLIAVPGLQEYFSSGTSNQDALNFIEDAHTFANVNLSQVNSDVREKINIAYDAYSSFIEYVNNVNSWNASNASELKQAAKNNLMNTIDGLIKSDDTKVLEQYYNYGLKRIINQHVRDTSASVTRNY